jgi:hypothetical protein
MRLVLFALCCVCRANFLLEYYYSGQGGFTELQSISDDGYTEYELLGGNQPTWPGWVDDIQYPSWADVSYNAPVDMTYVSGACSPLCGPTEWTTSTITVSYSKNLVNGNELMWVDPPSSTPEPPAWALIACGLTVVYGIRKSITG